MLLNKDLIAVNQDPLGKGGNKIGTSNCTQGAKYCQIWAKQLTGGAVAVALYNSVSNQELFKSGFHLENCIRGGNHGNFDIKGGQLKIVNVTS